MLAPARIRTPICASQLAPASRGRLSKNADGWTSAVCNAHVPWAELELKSPPEAGATNRNRAFLRVFRQSRRRYKTNCTFQFKSKCRNSRGEPAACSYKINLKRDLIPDS